MPAPYTFTFYTPADLQWTDRNGNVQTERHDPGDQRVVDNACDALALLNAVVDAGGVTRDDPETSAAISEVSAACGATPG
jgi:hypothetical protein